MKIHVCIMVMVKIQGKKITGQMYYSLVKEKILQMYCKYRHISRKDNSSEWTKTKASMRETRERERFSNMHQWNKPWVLCPAVLPLSSVASATGTLLCVILLLKHLLDTLVGK